MIARALVFSLAVLGLSASTERAHAQAAETSPPQRVDGIAAVVGGLAPGPESISILRSDVELRARLSLLREGSLARALGPLPAGLLRASLQELLGETLIAAEAERLGLGQPDGEALRAEQLRFFGGAARSAEVRELFAALGVQEREIAAAIERRALVGAFMEVNLQGTLEVSAAELERLFASEAHPFVDLTFEEARGRFAAWLTTQRTQRAVQTWVESLRQRMPHRVLASY